MQIMPVHHTVQPQFDQFFAEDVRSKHKMWWNNKPYILCFG